MSLVIDLVVLAWMLSRQITARPLSGGYTLPLILAVSLTVQRVILGARARRATYSAAERDRRPWD